ncbi:MAG: C45 family peptidase [Rhodospirillaceae bacterium]|nr:C45 family peptidase [Rhodospirillaceae bacterium]
MSIDVLDSTQRHQDGIDDGLGYVEISGDPYDVGVQIGQFGARSVNEYLIHTNAWSTVVSHRNDPRVMRMAARVEQIFPRYHAELSGLANGLGLEFEDVFAWNCRGDIWPLAPDGCTTVQIPQARNPEGGHIISHNEDGDPGFRGHCALLRIIPTDGPSFITFAYPGSLPGHTFAATDYGLVQTVNNIRALDIGDGLPRMVLTRAVLDCKNIDTAVSLLRTSERAGAFHVTLAKAGDPRMLSVEFTAEACSVTEITNPGVHANHLVHDDTANIRQIITDSSASRQHRGEDLINRDLSGDYPLSILHDDDESGLPIYRKDPDDPDHENTLATAVFSIKDDGVDWHVYGKVGSPPRFHIGKSSVSGF